jgi:hypothetical protein
MLATIGEISTAGWPEYDFHSAPRRHNPMLVCGVEPFESKQIKARMWVVSSFPGG